MLRKKLLIIAFVAAGSLFSFAASANTCPSASPQGVGCTSGSYYCASACRSGLSWCPTWSPSTICASGLDCSNCSSADACGVCNACNSGYRLCGAYPNSFCKANGTLPANCATYNTNCDACASCVAGYTLSGSSCVAATLKLGSSSVSGSSVVQGGADSALFVSGNKIGLGISVPTANLQINSSADTEGLRIITSNYSPFIIRNNADTADLFRIDENGNITSLGSVSGSNTYWNLNGSNLVASSTNWNVGIGTTNPSYKLYVAGGDINLDADQYIRMGGYATFTANSTRSLFGNTGYTQLRSNGVVGVTLDNSQNVGVGLTNPSAKLDVSGALKVSSSAQISLLGGSGNRMVTVDNTGVFGTAALPTTVGAGTSGQTLRHDGTSWVANSALYNNGTNVGIGTTNPNNKLEIKYTSTTSDANITSAYGLRINNSGWNSSQITGIEFWNGGVKTVPTSRIISQMNGNGSGGENLHFQTQPSSVTNPNPNQPTTKLSILADGNVGIGTTNPNSKLSVGVTPPGTGTATFLEVQGVNNPTYATRIQTTGSYNQGLIFDIDYNNLSAYDTFQIKMHGSQTPFLIDNSGNVGIGITNPGAKLDVNGTFKVSGALNSVVLEKLSGTGSRIVMADASGSLYATSSSVATGLPSSSTAGQTLRSDGTNWVANSVLYNNGANIGIGTTNPVSKLNIVSNAGDAHVTLSNINSATSSYVTYSLQNIAQQWQIGLHGDTSQLRIRNATNSTYPFVINTNGNVGIGTTNPTTNLHIVDNTSNGARFRLEGTYAGAGGRADMIFASQQGDTTLRLDAESTGSGNYIQSGNYAFNANKPLYFSGYNGNTGSTLGFNFDTTYFNNGNVGIGTTTPGTRLTVVGSGSYSIDAGNFRVGNVASPVSNLDAANKSYVDSVLAAATSTLTLWGGTVGGNVWNLNSGNVGIGTTNPNSYRLNVAGRLMSTSSSLSVNSDSVAMEDATSNLLYRTGAGNLTNVSFSYGTKTYLGNGRYRFVNTSGGSALIRFNANLADLVDGGTYAISIGYENLSAGIVIDWCDRPTTGVTSATSGNGRLYGTASRSPYDSTYRFFDVQLAAGGSVDLYADQLEYKNYPTSFVPGDRAAGDLVLGGRLSSYSASSSYFSGNLGIGITNPGAKLDVNGTFKVSGALNSVVLEKLSGTGSRIVMTDASGSLYATSSSVVTGLPSSSTAGQTLRSDGNSWLANSVLYNNGTNVGIGTTNPGALLHVNGNAQFGQNIDNSTSTPLKVSFGGTWGNNTPGTTGNLKWLMYDGGAAIKYGIGMSQFLMEFQAGNGGFAFYPNSASTQVAALRIATGGNVGIGTTAPRRSLDVVSSSNNPLILQSNSTTTGAYLSFYTGSGLGTARGYLGAGSQSGGATMLTGELANSISLVSNQAIHFGTNGNNLRMTIDTGGNVGIGTTDPGAKLDVNGTFKVSGALNSVVLEKLSGTGSRIVMADASGSLYATSSSVATGLPSSSTAGQTLRSDGTNWVANSVLYNNGANIGIGTTTPANADSWARVLDVYGVGHAKNIVTTNTGIETGIYSHNSGFFGAPTGGMIGTRSNHPLSFITNAAARMTILSNGNVGIGTTNPKTRLQVNESSLVNSPVLGTATGTITFAEPSALYGLATGVAGSGSTWFQSQRFDSSTTTYNILLNPSGGNVGIGTTNPGSKLDIGGSTQLNGAIFPIAAMTANSDTIQALQLKNISTGANAEMRFITAANDNSYLAFTQPSSNNSSTAFFGVAKSTGSFLFNTSNGGATRNMYIGTLEATSLNFGTNNTIRVSVTSAGNVGIGTTNPGAILSVSGGNAFINDAAITSGTPKAAVTKEYLDSSLSAFASTNNLWNNSGSNLYASSTTWNVGIGTTAPGAYKLNVAGSIYATGLTMGGDINLGGNNLSGINKLTVSTIDPLYNIKGVNYSTFASAIVGGVKEEYVGRINIDKQLGENEYEKIVDFDKLEKGSDLWVWRQVVDFSPENIQVLITPYGNFASTYYEISDNRLIFKADRPASISYRLIGKRFDWQSWPTKARDQEEKAGLIIH